MAIKPFNSVDGISVGEFSRDVIFANGDVTTENLTVNGVGNLGPIGNVIITGGNVGQVLTTNGSGNLSWADTASSNSAAPMPTYVPVGQSYTVPENFQGLFTYPITIDGEFEVDGILIQVGTNVVATNNQILFDNNGDPTGATGFTFDPLTGNMYVPGNGIYTGNLIPSANITYNLGSPTNRWKDIYLSNNTIYIGESSISADGTNLVLTNGDGGQVVVAGNGTATTDSLSNGNTAIVVNPSNVSINANGFNDVFIVNGSGANVTGNLAVTQNVTAGNLLSDNYCYANGQPLDLSQPAGTNTQVQFNNNSDFGASANLTFDSATNLLTVVGNIAASNANLGNIVSANYFSTESGCVAFGPSTVIAISGTNAGIFATGITDINLGLLSNINMGSTTGVTTIRGSVTANGITSLGNVSGDYLTGTLTTGAQPNITSTGTLSNLTVTGNVSGGNISVTDTVDAVNIKVTDLYTKRPAMPIGVATPIDTFSISEFRSAKYTMRAGSPDGFQALEVLLVHDDINSIITVYGSLSTTGSDLVVFTTDISSGNVNVYATAVGPNTNLNLMGTYVPD